MRVALPITKRQLMLRTVGPCLPIVGHPSTPRGLAGHFLRCVTAVAVFYAALPALSLMPDNVARANTPNTSNEITPAAGRDLQQAREAFERRDIKALGRFRDQFKNQAGLLAHYPEYWFLAASLSQTSDSVVNEQAAIERFLSAWKDSPLAEALRKDWLKALGRLDRWDLFEAELPLVNVEDHEIACHRLRRRLDVNDLSASSEIRALWHTTRALPDACYQLFEAACARNRTSISTREQWQRVRRLLDDNLLSDARRSAALIDKLPPDFERNTALIGQSPTKWLQKQRRDAKSSASVELFLFAIGRTARSQPERAAELLEHHGKALSEPDRRHAYARIGLLAAQSHHEQALDWYGRAGESALDDAQSAWKARAAMRAGQWLLLKTTIRSMDAVQRRTPTWQYWLAVASERTGESATARALREALVRDSPHLEGGYYALLAAEELGVATMPIWKANKASPEDIARMAGKPGIARAIVLMRLQLRMEALREWHHATRGMDDTALLAAAEAARLNGMPDRAISAAERTLSLHDFAQRYPTPHREVLSAQSKSWGLDESWVYGLVRQESRFMTDARSSVGAAGLMQLMPATARWAAQRTGVAPAQLKNINDVAVNLTLGTFYLKHVLDDLGHPVLATAAYNAGPGRARRWRAEAPLDGAIYAETIPFTETRDYVKKVMANTWFYAQQIGQSRVRLTDMLGRVPGKARGEPGTSSLVSLAANAQGVPQ